MSDNTETVAWLDRIDAHELHVLRWKQPTAYQLAGADLHGKSLDGIDLADTKLHGVDLSFAKLRRARLENASLGSANLQCASMSHASLCGAMLIGADLRDAHLAHADLTGADLEHANLRGACLRNANLSSADLDHADLRRANLWRANTLHADFGGSLERPAARFSARTVMPCGTLWRDYRTMVEHILRLVGPDGWDFVRDRPYGDEVLFVAHAQLDLIRALRRAGRIPWLDEVIRGLREPRPSASAAARGRRPRRVTIDPNEEDKV